MRNFCKGGEAVAEEKQGCYGCDHYIASVGEKGYCKLYRHETSLPEMCCPRFEEKKKDEPQIHEKIKIEKKTPVLRQNENFLALAAFFACTVLSVIGLMFGLYFVITLIGLPFVLTAVKVLTVLGTFALSLLGIFFLFNLGKKFLVARLFELFITVFVVAYVLINYETIWFNFHNFIMQVFYFVFGSVF